VAKYWTSYPETSNPGWPIMASVKDQVAQDWAGSTGVRKELGEPL
jgi:hypothetical protein